MRNMKENMWLIRILYFLFGWLYRFVVKTPFNGAQTTIYCAVDKGVENETGKYYSDCKEKQPNPSARIQKEQERLWHLSALATGLVSKAEIQCT